MDAFPQITGDLLCLFILKNEALKRWVEVLCVWAWLFSWWFSILGWSGDEYAFSLGDLQVLVSDNLFSGVVPFFFIEEFYHLPVKCMLLGGALGPRSEGCWRALQFNIFRVSLKSLAFVVITVPGVLKAVSLFSFSKEYIFIFLSVGCLVWSKEGYWLWGGTWELSLYVRLSVSFLVFSFVSHLCFCAFIYSSSPSSAGWTCSLFISILPTHLFPNPWT